MFSSGLGRHAVRDDDRDKKDQRESNSQKLYYSIDKNEVS